MEQRPLWLPLIAVVAIFSIFVLGLNGLLSQSPLPVRAQPVSPKPTSNEQKPQPKTQSSAGDSASEERGSPSRPLAIQVIDSEETRREKAEAAHQTENKHQIDWWLAAFTGLIAGFTLALAVATGFLARYTRRLWDATIKLGQDSERSIKATEVSAKATADQVIVSQQEFVASHRPRLKIRRIHNIVLRHSQRAGATIDAANIGDTGARVVGIGIDIFPRQTGTPAQFSAVPRPHSLQKTVEPGEQANIDVIGGHLMSAADIQNIMNKKVQLCMLGIIQYRDANDTMRLTSFFRVYDVGRQRFVRAPEDDEFADWEYED